MAEKTVVVAHISRSSFCHLKTSMNTFMKTEKVLVLTSSRCQAGVCERPLDHEGYINENLIKIE